MCAALPCVVPHNFPVPWLCIMELCLNIAHVDWHSITLTVPRVAEPYRAITSNALLCMSVPKHFLTSHYPYSTHHYGAAPVRSIAQMHVALPLHNPILGPTKTVLHSAQQHLSITYAAVLFLSYIDHNDTFHRSTATIQHNTLLRHSIA